MAFGVTYAVKNQFFDRAAVTREIGKVNATALSKVGAFVRRRARSSMRRRRRVSAPGSPPSTHSTDPVASLKNILFAYDRQRASVVIGPVRLNTSIGGLSIPAIHEFGASVPNLEVSTNGGRTWRVSGRRRQRRQGEIYRRGTSQYPARPFMGPALQAELPNFPSLWSQ